MPKLLVNADVNVNTNHGFQYSHIGIDKCTAMNYTIVHIVIDKSSSVSTFKKELENLIKTCVETCQGAPESENLLIRITAFSNGHIEEIHGYTLLSAIDISQYDGCILPGGMTPLYDATGDGAYSLKDFGKKMYDEQHTSNAVLFVVTDGDENDSSKVPNVTDVKKIMDELHRCEHLESFTAILIGVNTDDGDCSDFLKQYKIEGGFDGYKEIGKADNSSLGKLANFFSQSISSKSKDLNGEPSVPIDLNSLTI
jgi:hypothetical protein